jgi:hypothetical protein
VNTSRAFAKDSDMTTSGTFSMMNSGVLIEVTILAKQMVKEAISPST